MIFNTEFLRQTRKDKNIPLMEIADALGLKTPGGYLRIETGENKLKAEHLPILAKKFEISIEELLRNIFFESTLDDCSSFKELR
nr:helix-turn-helix transcriptional regulator [Fredinandcohnia onubensis]